MKESSRVVWLKPGNWTTTPEQIGNLDEYGVFTAGAAGSGVINAVFNDGDLIKSTSVYVDAGEIEIAVRDNFNAESDCNRATVTHRYAVGDIKRSSPIRECY
jgi:uncharacterized protein YjdB